MPIYEYACDACQKTFEELVRSSGSKVACPDCGSRKVTRQLSVFAASKPATETRSMPGPQPCHRCGDPGGACSM